MAFVLVLVFWLFSCCYSIDPLRGVSLGGHIVPEPFIDPEFWENITAYCPGAKDIWNLCKCTFENPYSSAMVAPKVRAHLASFFDLNELKSKTMRTDVNVWRYPISYTYFLDAAVEPIEFAKYKSCGLVQDDLKQSSFVSVLNLAKSLGVRVILDLHQVEGCQNGFDNGGHAGTKLFYIADNIQKGINTWVNIIKYLQQYNLMDLIWGFEILNEPLPDTQTDMALLQQFTENVVWNVLKPVLSSSQVVVLQPGPGNALVANYEAYNLPALTYVFDFHEYICFGNDQYLNTMGSVLPGVYQMASNGNGATKWPYFIGEWSFATTDCAQYLNGRFGGYDPNYYQNQHSVRNTYNCNQIDQIRDGFTVGFQTCSVIVNQYEEDNLPSSYGVCDASAYRDVFKQYRGAVCKLLSTYISAFQSNSNNVGFVFWTFKTGSNAMSHRRIQQWDYSWTVDNNITKSLLHPTPIDQCDSI